MAAKEINTAISEFRDNVCVDLEAYGSIAQVAIRDILTIPEEVRQKYLLAECRHDIEKATET